MQYILLFTLYASKGHISKKRTVPLQETIDIILQRISDKNEIATTIPRDDMKSLLSLCTSKSCFLFNDTLYEQIEGISMGSPLGSCYG